MEMMNEGLSIILRQFILPLVVGISVPIFLGVINRISTMESDISYLQADMAVAMSHSVEHDRNSGEWKDRIIATEEDIKALEAKLHILNNQLWQIGQEHKNEN